MNYLIGDLQGCCDALERLLAHAGFSPSRDRLYLLGDLVNRGPASLATLRRLQSLGDAATSVLGNHDLHLLAVAHGVREPSRGDTFQDVLQAPDRTALLEWLRHQHLALHAHGWLMVHAGVAPQWDLALTLTLAREVEQALRGPEPQAFLRSMYGNEPSRWSDDLKGDARLRFAVNAFTRLRFCKPDGALDFSVKEGLDAAPPGYLPWFDMPQRRTADISIAFGHWSTLGLLNRPDLVALDTGCVWGGRLSAMRLDGIERTVIQIDCEQAQRPG